MIITLKDGTTITPTQAASLLKQQAAGIGQAGTIDLFGETRTDADVLRAIKDLGRVAQMYAELAK